MKKFIAALFALLFIITAFAGCACITDDPGLDLPMTGGNTGKHYLVWLPYSENAVYRIDIPEVPTAATVHAMMALSPADEDGFHEYGIRGTVTDLYGMKWIMVNETMHMRYEIMRRECEETFNAIFSGEVQPDEWPTEDGSHVDCILVIHLMTQDEYERSLNMDSAELLGFFSGYTRDADKAAPSFS